MQNVDLFAKLLELPEEWKVSELETNFDEQSITVHLEWSGKTKTRCPECNEECGVYDHREKRVWRHLDTMQFKTYLAARVPRVNCDKHGVKTVKTSWAGAKSRFTVLFERFANDVPLSATTIEQARQLLGLSWDQIHVIQKRAVERGLARRADHTVPHLGIDEKQFLCGQDYSSVLYNITKGTVVDLFRARDEKSARRLLFSLSAGARCCVDVVAMDMWKPYENAVQEVFPNAEIVFDRFHISKRLNEAVDAVRRTEVKELRVKGFGEILTGAHFAILKNPESQTAKKRWRFDLIQEAELKTARAVAIRESFRHFWSYRYQACARNFFEERFWWASHSRLQPIRKVAWMIRNHFEHVITRTKWHISNAVSECINVKIQVIKASARGFWDFENFRIAVLFHCGGLQLYLAGLER